MNKLPPPNNRSSYVPEDKHRNISKIPKFGGEITIVKYGKYSSAKFLDFVYICIIICAEKFTFCRKNV